MKALIMILGLSLQAHAGNYFCGGHGLIDDTQRRAFGFLSSLPREMVLGDCAIEINMCDDRAPFENGSTVGDLVVTDRHRQSFHLNFDFSLMNTAKTQKVIINGRRMVHYEFTDRIPDPQSGRTESYRLEILKSDDLQSVVSLHLGIYTSRLRDQYPRLRPGRSYWVICEGQSPTTQFLPASLAR